MKCFETSDLQIWRIPLILSVICLFYPSSGTAFTCYKCTSNENAPCIEELNSNELPPTISLVECSGFCTIVRTEYTDIPGEIVTLVRDCEEEEPLVLNDIRTDKHYTKMYTSCTTERCNSGDGKREPTENSGPIRGPSSLIIVPESNSGTTARSIYPFASIFVCLFVKLYFSL